MKNNEQAGLKISQRKSLSRIFEDVQPVFEHEVQIVLRGLGPLDRAFHLFGVGLTDEARKIIKNIKTADPGVLASVAWLKKQLEIKRR